MPSLPILGALLFLVTAEPSFAQQDAPLPLPDSPDPLPSATVNPAVTPGLAPQLIPTFPLPLESPPPVPPLPTTPTIPQLDEAFKQNPVNTAAANERLHVEWRILKNRFVSDPAVRSAKDAVKTARTDLIRRELLRKYWILYFDKMIAAAAPPELKAYVTARKAEQVAAVLQPRVRPTPTPTATPKPR